MSVLAWLHAEAQLIEADVQKVVAAIIKGEKVVIADLEKSLAFINASAPQVINALGTMAAFVELLGPSVPAQPAILASLEAAKEITTGLQAFADQYQKATVGGGITATAAHDTVVAGYNTLVTAKAAINKVAEIATAPAPKA